MICITRLQALLYLLMLQIRPCADGMDVPLVVLEAMDCVVIEIFHVYGEICTGLTRFLVSGVPDGSAKPRMGKAVASCVLWWAVEQSAQLFSYFELYRGHSVGQRSQAPRGDRPPSSSSRGRTEPRAYHHGQRASRCGD
jgi:hypothetical protein